MREIKFRAWNVEDGCWFKIETTTPVGILSSGRFRVSQYIGLNDFNGNEIYEGDVLQCVDCGKESRGSVVYQEGLCAFSVEFNDSDGSKFRDLILGYKSEHAVDCWGIEVIGNIFENPKLMDG
jgi:uncharacterized phage protein (TIGR01671 family)